MRNSRQAPPSKPSFRDGALAPDPESRDSGFDASHRRGMTASRLLRLAMTAGMSGKPLPPGLAAARGFGVIDRAEPARALTDVHLDLRIPAAGRLVIDAFAGPVDIALDGAVGRGRDRSRRRCQENRVGARGWLGGAENGRLLVADAPVPRRDERALPHPGLGLARRLLVGNVIVGDADESQRPAIGD